MESKKEVWLLGGLAGLATFLVAAGVFFALFEMKQTFSTEYSEVVGGDILDSDDQDQQAGGNTQTPVSGASSQKWPIYITTMTHLEGQWTMAETDKRFFDGQAKKVRHAMDIAEAYGGLLTIETEEPMARGMTIFNDNFLQEVRERGHGVGTHCDINPKITYSDTDIVAQFLERKVLVDDLVGADENLGCSGGGGPSDWYVGATGAGFLYINGVVGFHYMALPLSQRPSGWTDTAIAREFYHYGAPQDEKKYFYPFLISKVGFTEDIQGDLLVSDGTLGNISTLAEIAPWSMLDYTACSDGSCAFTNDDGDAVEDFIRDFAKDFDGSRPAKITVYLPTSIMASEDDEAMHTFFADMKELVDEGIVVWQTQRGVYDEMMKYYETVR